MQLLVSTLSLIIVVPILYFLPIKLSNKEKGLLLILSFFYANIGLLARDMYPLWQIAVILFLLIVLTAYLLNKRLYPQIYKGKKKLSDTVIIKNVNHVVVNEQALGETVIETKEEKEIPSDVLDVEINNFVLHEETSKLKEDVEKEMVRHLESENFNDEEGLIEETIFDEEISFLNEREQMLKNGLTVDFEDQEQTLGIVTEGYMSDIEQMLLNDDFIPHQNETNDDEIDVIHYTLDSDMPLDDDMDIEPVQLEEFTEVLQEVAASKSNEEQEEEISAPGLSLLMKKNNNDLRNNDK